MLDSESRKSTVEPITNEARSGRAEAASPRKDLSGYQAGDDAVIAGSTWLEDSSGG